MRCARAGRGAAASGARAAASRRVRALLRVLVLFLVLPLATPSALAATGPGAIAERIRAESGVEFIDLAVTSADGPCTRAHYSDPVPRLHAGSLSELLTAVVVLQLVEAGRVDLHDPLGRHLPAFEGSLITVADLLAHRSGLRDPQGPRERRTQQAADAYFAALARQQPRSPGEPHTDRRPDYHHASANYNLLGRLIESLEAQPFPAVMQARLLDPLGMFDSSFAVDAIPEAAQVQGWQRRWGRLVAGLPPADRAFAPSLGLQTTATDLARFARAVLAAAEGLDDDVIAPRTIRRMTPPSMTNPDHEDAGGMEGLQGLEGRDGIERGVGWQLAATELGPQWLAGSAADGFGNLLTVYPQRGFAVVVMGNRTDWPRLELERALREQVVANGVCGPLVPASTQTPTQTPARIFTRTLMQTLTQALTQTHTQTHTQTPGQDARMYSGPGDDSDAERGIP